MRKKFIIGIVLIIAILGASVFIYKKRLKPLDMNGEEKLVKVHFIDTVNINNGRRLY